MIDIEKLTIKVEQFPHDGGVYSLNFEGEKLWIKTQGEEKRNPIRIISVWLSKIKALNFFQVNSILSSAERLSLEVENIKVMAKTGLPVPELVLAGEGYFVTRDGGIPINRLDSSNFSIQSTLVKAFTVLAEFHQKGFYHGRPALRDILRDDDGNISFIDFEESGLLKNPQLMARDVFILLMDSGKFSELSHEDRLTCLKTWATLAPDNLNEELNRIYHKVKRLAFLARWVLKFKDNKTSRLFLSSLKVMEDFFAKHS